MFMAAHHIGTAILCVGLALAFWDTRHSYYIYHDQVCHTIYRLGLHFRGWARWRAMCSVHDKPRTKAGTAYVLLLGGPSCRLAGFMPAISFQGWKLNCQQAAPTS